MEVLKVDYVGMVNDANSFVKLARRLSTEISNLKDAFCELDIFWDGMANAQFKVTLESDFLTMEAMALKIRHAGAMLKEAVDEYVSVENILNEMIGGL